MLNQATQNMIEAIYPLSPIQQGMLFYSVAQPEDDPYVVQWSCTWPETLRVQHFEQAWQRVIARHSVLRTAFLWQDLEEPLQIVGREASIQVTCLDWSGLPDFQTSLDQWLHADRSQGFVLSVAPLMRLTLIRQPDKAVRFIWSYHHLLLDGWSWPLILREVFTLYEALIQGEEPTLPDVRPYKDYIAWLQQQDLHQAEAFWRQTLSGFSETTPFGIDRAHRGSDPLPVEYDTLEFQLSETVSQALYTFARQQKITMNTLLQGAWALLLRSYSGSDDVVFGSVVSGRPFDMDGVDAMVGVFINTLPVRVRMADAQSLQAWLRDVQWQQLEARQYEYSPLLQVQKWSDVPPGQPLFESLLIYENYPIDTATRRHGHNLHIRDIAYKGRTNYPLTIGIEGGRALAFRLVYDTTRFETQAIQRLSKHLQQLLQNMMVEPAQSLGSITPLGPSEREFLLTTLNQTAYSYPHQALHEIFEERAAHSPHAMAAVFANEQVTYRELNRRANWYAHRLRSSGVASDVLVGLYVERSIDMLAGLLGILKAGGAYVPLDTTYPQERLAYILEDTRVPVILTQRSLEPYLPPSQAQVVLLDVDWAAIPDELENPAVRVEADNLAYIIYTSGSTGKPKGVMVSHQGVANIIHTQRTHLPELSPESRILQFASLCFDASVWEICLALATGATLFLGSRETLQAGPHLVSFLQEHEITLATLPPALLAALPAEHSLPALRTVVTGGETCSLDVVRRWGREKAFYNVYGPTETTIGATCTRCNAQVDQDPPIGKPILNTQVYLLDKKLSPVHLGGVGEIYIGGSGVARGYLNRPDVTAERFLPNPFSAEPGARLYKTGDLARYLPDGQIEYQGRNDQQIKIRGYRIELAEIDVALKQHPALHDAITLVRDEGGVKRLVAYIIAQKTTVSPGQLRQFLAERLPAYMVPSAFVFLDAFPLNTNNKIDRQALPAPAWEERTNYTSVYAVAQTPNQKLLVEVWENVLGRDQIGIHDNFFELGGDSIISLQIVMQAAGVGLQLTPRQLFQYPTIAELALVISTLDEETPEQCSSNALSPDLAELSQEQLECIIAGNDIEHISTLSPLQQGILFHTLYTPHAGTYIIQRVVRFTGKLDVAALMQAWQDAIARHAILRTAFAWKGVDEPIQIVYRTGRLSFQQLDWCALPEQEQQQRLDQLLQTEKMQDFDLTQPSLLRLILIELREDAYYFVENIHHLLIDGWSSTLLQQEIFDIYLAHSQHNALTLKPVKPYYEYIAWLKQQDLVKAEQFWRQQLAGIEGPTLLPFEQGPATDAQGHASYTQQRMTFSSEFTAQLQAVARHLQITLNTLLQGAWALLLSHYSGNRDVLYGTTVAGRPTHLPGSDHMVGLFINTLPMRVCVPPAASLADWLKMLQAQQAIIQQYDYCSLVQMQGWSAIPRNFPLFKSLFVFENYPTRAVGLSARTQGRLSAEQLSSTGQTNYPLTIVVEPATTLSLQAIYACDHFSAEAIERLLGHLLTMLTEFVDHPHKPLGDMAYLTTRELDLLLQQHNRTVTDYPHTHTIHQRFTEQAQLTPNGVAVVYGEESLTYRDLNERTNRLASYLRSQGVKPGAFVALYMERSCDLIVALLGILKAGGAYVPLDLSYPDERLAFMLADSAASLLLTHSTLCEQVPSYQGQRICLDSDWQTIARYSPHNHEEMVTSEYPAYMMYTSGSTGVPKGVCIPHKSVIRLVCNTNYLDFSAADRICQASNTSFDAATFEIWGALLHGGCLLGVSREMLLSLHDFACFVRQQHISAVFVTTALFNQIARTVPTLFQTVRTVMFGGEAVDPHWVREILHHGAPQRLLHVYGPTESTTFATWYEIARVSEQATTIPIGRPLANTTCYILDAHLQPVPIGVPGELYIGGDGLALGYWQRPELSAERFIPSPWGLEPGARLYRTGDLVYKQEDGNIVFCSRIDSQVKLRGFRIELGEIETLLIQNEAIRSAIVLLREDEPGEKRLVAYVQPQDPHGHLEHEKLQRQLQEKIPAYMLPSAFVQVETWPLTPNGKIDRASLPLPSHTRLEQQDRYVAPRNEIERQLVEIWEQILHIHPIGVADDFFSLGGHSLLAIRLVAQIQQRFGQQLPLPVLFEYKTIEKLAGVLEQEEKPAIVSPLVAIQPHGSHAPFFCVHPGSGNVFQYQEMARYLGADQPVYAFQDVTVYADTEVVDDSIENMAARYLQELLTVQREGPYYLGGYSFGGVVALEMALKLMQMGQQVALLVIFDGGTPRAIRHSMGDGTDEVLLLAIVSLELLRAATSWTLDSLYATLKTLEPQQRFAFVVDQLRQTGLTLEDTNASIALLQRQLQVFQCRIRSMRAYQPPCYHGKITLLRACEVEMETSSDLERDLGWGELSSLPIDIYPIPGHHDTLFLPPNVHAVVACLKQCLLKAGAL